jgi:hypothetical protein
VQAVVLMFPAYMADHDGVGFPVNIALKVEGGRVTFKVVDDKVLDFPYRVYAVGRGEYVSNSGSHSLDVVNIEPVLVIGGRDIYVFEELASISLLDADLKPYGYSRPVKADEAYKVALELYAYYARKPVLPTGAFLWRTSRGYILAKLARQVDVEDFLEASDEYTVRYFLLRG